MKLVRQKKTSVPYTDSEIEIMSRDLSMKEMVALLPGRTASGISNYRSTHGIKRSTSLVKVTKTKKTKRNLPALFKTPEIKVVPKQRSITFIIDGVTVHVDKLAKLVSITSEAIIVNR